MVNTLFPNYRNIYPQEFGKGLFLKLTLKNMRQFYTVFPDFKQLATHCVANLSWTNTSE